MDDGVVWNFNMVDEFFFRFSLYSMYIFRVFFHSFVLGKTPLCHASASIRFLQCNVLLLLLSWSKMPTTTPAAAAPQSNKILRPKIYEKKKQLNTSGMPECIHCQNKASFEWWKIENRVWIVWNEYFPYTKWSLEF